MTAQILNFGLLSLLVIFVTGTVKEAEFPLTGTLDSSEELGKFADPTIIYREKKCLFNAFIQVILSICKFFNFH